MNVHSPEHKRLAASYAEVHKRLWNARPVAKVEPLPEPVVVTVKAMQIPLWMQEPTLFDAHVHDFRATRLHLLNWAASPCRAHILKRCAELGVTFTDITGPSRRRDLVARRHLLMWEIKRFVKPSMSYPELGRLFGGRDHTAVYYAVEKMKAALEGDESSAKKILKKGKRVIPKGQWISDVFQGLESVIGLERMTDSTNIDRIDEPAKGSRPAAGSNQTDHGRIENG